MPRERMRKELDPRCFGGECASSWIHDAFGRECASSWTHNALGENAQAAKFNAWDYVILLVGAFLASLLIVFYLAVHRES